MKVPAVMLAAASALALTGCGGPAPSAKTDARAALPPPSSTAAPIETPPPIVASASPLAQAIDGATWSPDLPAGPPIRNLLIRTEVLLSRAHFSPGVIDGRDGANLKNALSA